MAVLDGGNQQKASKAALEQKANATRRKMEQANNLINGLAGENARWTEDSNNFADAAPSTASSAIAWSLNVSRVWSSSVNVSLKITP